MLSRLAGAIVLLLIATVCPPQANATVRIHTGIQRQHDIDHAMAKPEAQAINAWLVGQGYTELAQSEALTGDVDNNDDVEIPYMNHSSNYRANLERVVQQGKDSFGAFIYTKDQYGSVIGWSYVYDRQTNTIRPTDQVPPTNKNCVGCLVVRLFTQWENCVGGGTLGNLVGSALCGDAYLGCLGGTETSTLISCGWTFWSSWLG
jgi:hypothetical protein